jgi:transposase
MFPWCWLADLCADEEIPFVLGHAFSMKAIHGGKAKNDKIDSQKIAVLLRGGMLPQAYVYPAERRATCDLLRRRMHLAHKRGELLAHVQNTNSQYNLPAIGKNIAYKANRDGVAERFADPAVQKSIEVDLSLVSSYDELLRGVELTILKTAKQHDPNTLYLLQTVPGIGKILSLVLLYEIHHGECEVWRVVHVPSVEAEDQRHLHRDLQPLKQERASTTTRIKGLFSSQGVRLTSLSTLPEQLDALRLWDGAAIPRGLR